ncbi:MAG: hypothetical protein KDD36_10490 [Flavobacteriales bacterium]|nr:hypothetical protein [Flavobacteriales bacterium]
MKSGKVVYGVIWEERLPSGERQHFFSSPGDYHSYLVAYAMHDMAACQNLRHHVRLSEVIGAEVLEEEVVILSRPA